MNCMNLFGFLLDFYSNKPEVVVKTLKSHKKKFKIRKNFCSFKMDKQKVINCYQSDVKTYFGTAFLDFF